MHGQAAVQAIRTLRSRVRWKPGRDVPHLEKRKAMGHLPAEATMEDYHLIIGTVLRDGSSLVYRYPFGTMEYCGVSGEVGGVAWLIIFSAQGEMETAFPPDDLADYLSKRGFVLLGRMKEIVP